MNENQNDQNQNAPQQGEYSDLPPYLQKYFKFKDALKGPDLLRDEDGFAPKRFSRNYFEDTCPFCETTTEHEGKKYKYSRITKRKILINSSLMLLAAFLTGIGVLNIFIGFAAIMVLGYTTSTHTERKMYYSLICRNCGAHFPMDKDEQDKIRQEEKEKREEEEQEKKEQEEIEKQEQEQEEIEKKEQEEEE